MVERWSKLSDNQLKAGTLPAGLTCANLHIVEASDVQLRGKGQGFLEVALEQAETARKELFEQNRKLRGILLSAANELQHVLHTVRTGEAVSVDEVSRFRNNISPRYSFIAAHAINTQCAVPQPVRGTGWRDVQYTIPLSTRHYIPSDGAERQCL